MKKFQFDSPNYTQTPNALFDDLLKEIDDLSELKVTLAAVRMTKGWHKEEAELSQAYLEKMTGLARNSVRRGLALAIKRGTILVKKPSTSRTGGVYSLNVRGSATDTLEGQPLTRAGGQPLTPLKKESIQKKKKENIYITTPVENDSPPEKALEAETFGALIKDVQERVTNFTPRMAQEVGELWDDYPDIDAHIHAMAQTDKFANGFNLKYYETCLSSWWAKHKKGKVIYGEQPSNDESENHRHGASRPESADGRAGQRTDAGVSQPTARASGAALLPRVSGGHRTGARSDPAP